MSGTVGVALITAGGAAIIALMGLASVRADNARRTMKKNTTQPSSGAIKKVEISITSMADRGYSNGNASFSEENVTSVGGRSR